MTAELPADASRVLWSPYWYDMDQALAVGRREEMWFFTPTPAEAVTRGFPFQFHCGFPDDLFPPERHERAARAPTVQRRLTTIVAIEHDDWGALLSVATGLDYVFELADGRRVVADAEGEGGSGIEPEAGEYIWAGDDSGFAPGYAALPSGVPPPTTWDLAVAVTFD